MSRNDPRSGDKRALVDAALARLWPETAERRDAGPSSSPSASDEERAIASRVEAIWGDVPLLRDRERYAELLGEPTWRERMVAGWQSFLRALQSFGRAPAFAASAAVLLIVSAATFSLLRVPGGETFETAKAQTQLVNLDDGSAVTLGAASRLSVDYSPAARNVTLAAGEAFFSVTHDSNRPFIVTAGDIRIQVVGTKFNVNRTADGVRVSVLEGLVRVIEQGRSPATVAAVPRALALRAGQQADAPVDAATVEVSSLAITQPGSWRTGSLTYEDAELSQIVADANRYYPRQIRIESRRGARMRLTTSFRTTQVDQFLETVEMALPLDVQRGEGGEIRIVDRR